MKEIQTGLLLEEHAFIAYGKTYYNSRLNSADGYCFYNRTEEVYDEDGNVVENPTPTQRMYMRSVITPITDVNELNNIYVSVPIEEGFEIV